MIEEILKKINNIEDLNKKIMDEAIHYQLKLAKPPKSLGKLEDIAVKISGITSKLHNHLDHNSLLVFASDNGVYEEGVSTTPQSVTYAQSINLTLGKTGAATLCKTFNVDLKVYDVGVIGDLSNTLVINKKIKEGTANIKKGPAMTKDECYKALMIGFKAVEELKDSYDCFGIGEMGIANTTTSSAILSVLLGLPVEEVTGKGAGLSDLEYQHKIEVIKEAIRVNEPTNDIIDVLTKLGGFDIISMAGAYLACAYYHKLVIIDGIISIAAALAASKFNKKAASYMLASHKSYEIGYLKACKELGLTPLLDLDMRLGEGSGCPLAMQIVKAACAIQNDMASFEEAKINDDYIEKINDLDHYQIKKD